GARLAARRSFADHHYFTDDDLSDLLRQADAAGVDLVTTAKDAVRIRRPSEVAARFLQRLSVIEIDAVFDLPDIPERIVRATLDAYKA
ncbi:tetraacyldisaccharide 4'-kinase, partial [archaeon]